jgi:[protein-PII] uridylyltransferase
MLQDDTPLEEPKTPTIRSNVLMQRVPVRVRTLPLASFSQTAIEVTAADTAGLLAALTYEITQAGFVINGASISSFGERIVDVFFIQDGGNQLSPEQIKSLSKTLKEVATLEGKDEAKDE